MWGLSHLSRRPMLWLRPANSWSCANSSVSCDAQSSCAKRTIFEADWSFNDKRKSEKPGKSQLRHDLEICHSISRTDLNRKSEKVKKLLEIMRSKNTITCIYVRLSIYLSIYPSIRPSIYLHHSTYTSTYTQRYTYIQNITLFVLAKSLA